MLEVAAGIKARLVAASVTGANQTYFVEAESGVSSPYIIVDFVGGGDMNDTQGGDVRDELWQVAVWSQSKSRATASNQARTIQAALKAALHKQQANITISGWRCELFLHQAPFWSVDKIAGEPAYYAGGTYRVLLLQSS